ncbi:AP-1 complex subunit beta-1, partial [Dissostichus eleginoides]
PGPPQPGPAALLSGAGDRRGLDHLRLPHRSQDSSSRQAPSPAPSQAPLWCSTAQCGRVEKGRKSTEVGARGLEL